MLKKNLIKLHLLSAASSNSKATSHKTLSTNNLTLQNILRLSHHLISPRLLTLLKCKASKKFKVALSSISLVWRICNSNFNFQEAFSSPDLAIIVEGRSQQASYLLSNWNRREEMDKKLDLIVYAVQSCHEIKNSNQSVYICIKNGTQVVGKL